MSAFAVGAAPRMLVFSTPKLLRPSAGFAISAALKPPTLGAGLAGAAGFAALLAGIQLLAASTPDDISGETNIDIDTGTPGRSVQSDSDPDFDMRRSSWDDSGGSYDGEDFSDIPF